MRSNAFRVFACVCCLSAGVAYAGSVSSFSFTGAFTQDDQLEIFLFTAPSASITAETWSYAGGTNAAGDVIAPGGFDPVLSLFDATGGFSASSPLVATSDGGSSVKDPTTKDAFDSILTVGSLSSSDTYALVLSEYDNLPYGTTYGDGFSQTGNGNFTPGEFYCSGGGPFCDAGGNQRNGNWAVDIVGAGSAVDTSSGGTSPEPGSVVLLTAGLGGLALLRRRRKHV
jgi:hypothetical protein